MLRLNEANLRQKPIYLNNSNTTNVKVKLLVVVWLDGGLKDSNTTNVKVKRSGYRRSFLYYTIQIQPMLRLNKYKELLRKEGKIIQIQPMLRLNRNKNEK